MTELDLDEIAKRAERAAENIGTSSYAFPCVKRDIPALIEEIKRLRGDDEYANYVDWCLSRGKEPAINREFFDKLNAGG